MEPKTKTTIGTLQPGDRFYFVSDVNRMPYQIVKHEGKYAAYNVTISDGNYGWKFNKLSSHIKQVVFLRKGEIPVTKQALNKIV